MEQFKWGEEFLKINFDLLELYAAQNNSDGVVKAQNDWLESVEKEAKERKDDDEDLPPSYDEYNEMDQFWEEEQEPVLFDKFGNTIEKNSASHISQDENLETKKEDDIIDTFSSEELQISKLSI